jgi:hypothetical protein
MGGDVMIIIIIFRLIFIAVIIITMMRSQLDGCCGVVVSLCVSVAVA